MNTLSASEVITGFLTDINAGLAEQAFARLAPDMTYHVVAPAPYGGTMDALGLKRTAAIVFERLAAPLQLTVHLIDAEGDRVEAQVSGAVPTKSGARYDNDYLFLFRVVDGLFVDAREYLDSAKFVTLVEGRL